MCVISARKVFCGDRKAAGHRGADLEAEEANCHEAGLEAEEANRHEAGLEEAAANRHEVGLEAEEANRHEADLGAAEAIRRVVGNGTGPEVGFPQDHSFCGRTAATAAAEYYET